jgi:hypothetical protein
LFALFRPGCRDLRAGVATGYPHYSPGGLRSALACAEIIYNDVSGSVIRELIVRAFVVGKSYPSTTFFPDFIDLKVCALFRLIRDKIAYHFRKHALRVLHMFPFQFSGYYAFR